MRHYAAILYHFKSTARPRCLTVGNRQTPRAIISFKTVLLLLITLSARGQRASTDSLRVLREVEVVDSRLVQLGSGDQVAPVLPQAIGAVAHRRLGELLMQYSAVNVRSYGPSGLSTASLRGTGGNHTAVFWEGINLQSSMNGGLDLTLVPVSFVDDVSLQFGGAGSLYGSGTLGGAIHLGTGSPDPTLGGNGRVHQQFGSFGQHYTGVNAGYRTAKTGTTLRWFDQRADYDYPFFNRFTQRKERRRHAGIDQHGVLVEQDWTPHAAHRLSAKYWYQDNHVQLPEIAAAGGGARATQADVFHRAVLHWQHQRTRQSWQARSALLYHRLAYHDPAGAQSDDRSYSWIAEGERTYYFDREHWLHTGLTHTYETAEVTNYPRPASRHRTALFASYRMLPLPSLEATVGVRETLIDRRWSPVLPSLGLAYRLAHRWQLRAKSARSYRVPTFNDLYWAGGGGAGNPDLQPERGWSHELGASWETRPGTSRSASAALTVFSNRVDQWIHWLPREGNVWSPVNVEQVWARGLELSGSAAYRLGEHLSARLWTHYSYTKSTKEAIEAGGNPRELHRQMVYTPYHQAKTSLQLHYRALTVGYSGLYVGEQYTTASNQRRLPAYPVHNVSLDVRWPLFEQHALLVGGQLNNLFARAYEVREGYPMPGRSYQLSLTYQFNQ